MMNKSILNVLMLMFLNSIVGMSSQAERVQMLAQHAAAQSGEWKWQPTDAEHIPISPITLPTSLARTYMLYGSVHDTLLPLDLIAYLVANPQAFESIHRKHPQELQGFITAQRRAIVHIDHRVGNLLRHNLITANEVAELYKSLIDLTSRMR